MYSEKLASISEYGDTSTTTTSLAGLSNYSNYTRSPSGDSLNTLATTSRSWKNGLPGEKNSNVDDTLSQRIITGKSLTHKHNYELCKKVRITMALIGILLLVAAIFMLSFYLPQQYGEEKETFIVPPKKQRIIWDDTIEITEDFHLIFSTNLSEPVLNTETGPKVALKVYLGELINKNLKRSINKTLNINSTEPNLYYEFESLTEPKISLNIKKNNFSEKCYDFHWIAQGSTVLEDCFDTVSAHWYGLGELFHQKWPLSRSSFANTPFLTSDFLDHYTPSVFGGVLEPFAVNSKGGGIFIADFVPLHVSMNEKSGKFCIQANKSQYNHAPFRSSKVNTTELFYTVCIRDNIRQVHKVMFDHFISKPIGVPDKEMMLTPIWSTWVRYKKEINREKVLAFAKEIRDNKFEGSILEIDDQYSTEYGDYNFRLDKFSNAVTMLQTLEARGFRVTVWVHPFSNFKSAAFLEGVEGKEKKKGGDKILFFMKSGPKDVPGICKWWNGMGGILDTTNKDATMWFQKKLEEFMLLPIKGFKFDAGEVNYLPYGYVFSKPLVNPNYYSYHYVELTTKFKLKEVRVAYKTQKFPVLLRLLDRTSSWGIKVGLQSVLTATMTFGILGYPFILPDYVGGNAYIEKPRRELYVRWAQLSAFLPSLQFSITPWDYDNKTIHIVQEALQVRKNLSTVIYDLAKNVQVTGEPIIRPLWWYWPTDAETFVIESQFMLGSEYLIAPVLNINVVKHAIYLPKGIWEEQWSKKGIINMKQGGVRYYNVTIRDICYFKLLKNMPSHNKTKVNNI